MTALAWLIPAALFLGLLGVLAFLWALRSGQFDDLDGAAYRALEDDPPDAPKSEAPHEPPSTVPHEEHGARRDHSE
jgi:cbb3-type cytochrome oxidase maturation protein